MENILTAMALDYVLNDFRKSGDVITAHIKLALILASDIDYRLIVFRKELFQMILDNLAEIGADLDNSVKIIQVGNIKGYAVAFIVSREFAIVPGTV